MSWFSCCDWGKHKAASQFLPNECENFGICQKRLFFQQVKVCCHLMFAKYQVLIHFTGHKLQVRLAMKALQLKMEKIGRDEPLNIAAHWRDKKVWFACLTWDCMRLLEIGCGYLRSPEIVWDWLWLLEISWNELRLLEITLDFLRWVEVTWDYLRWVEVTWDYLRLLEITWDYLRLLENASCSCCNFTCD